MYPKKSFFLSQRTDRVVHVIFYGAKGLGSYEYCLFMIFSKFIGFRVKYQEALVKNAVVELA